MKKLLVLGLLALIPHLATAQAVVGDIIFDWTAPKSRENGAALVESELAKAVVYTVGGTASKPTYTKRAEFLPGADGKFPTTGTLLEVSGSSTYVMTVVDKSGLESKYSNPATISIDVKTLSVPGAPAIRGRVVFRIK